MCHLKTTTLAFILATSPAAQLAIAGTELPDAVLVH